MKRLAIFGTLAALAVVAIALAIPLNQYPYAEKGVPMVVIGERARPSDVVAAVDVATRFAEIQKERVPVRVPALPVEVDGAKITNATRSNPPSTGWVDKAIYSKLVRDVVADSKGEKHYVLEQIQADVASFGINVTEPYMELVADSVQYKIAYTPSMPLREKVKILGKEYEVIEVTDVMVKLGETKTGIGLGKGGSVSIGPYRVEVGEALRIPAESVKLTIYKDGQAVKTVALSAGQNYTGSAEDGTEGLIVYLISLTVPLEAVEPTVDLKVVWVNTLAEKGKDWPRDANYKVAEIVVEGNKFVGIQLSNKVGEAGKVVLKAGEEFAGPEGYFKLTFRGLLTEGIDVETISYDRDGMVKFLDKNRLETVVNVSAIKEGLWNITDLSKGDVLAVKDYAVWVEDKGANWIVLKHRAWSKNVTNAATYPTGYGFDVTVVVSGGVLAIESTGKLATSLGAYINRSGVIEESNALITVNYDSANKKYNVTAITTDPIDTENEKGRSDYGSVITLGTGRESVTIQYPDKQIMAEAVLGEIKVPEAVEVYREVVKPITTPIARLDTEVAELAALRKNVIIVGGPCVNKWAARVLGVEFPTCGEDFTAATGVGENQALIQVFEDVIPGYYVVLVTGYEAADTRAACAALQQFDTALKGITENKLILSKAEHPQLWPS